VQQDVRYYLNKNNTRQYLLWLKLTIRMMGTRILINHNTTRLQNVQAKKSPPATSWERFGFTAENAETADN
jgi:hypothetical protein